MKLSLLFVAALAILLIAQVASCQDEELELEIAKERKALELDRRAFNWIRVRNIVDGYCVKRRHRRTAYKMLKELEQEREQAIRKLLDEPKKGLNVAEFYAQLRRINSAALDKVKPITDEAALACAYPNPYDVKIKDLPRLLRSFLEKRRDLKDYHQSATYYPYEDVWDESEVDLRTDGKGIKAVATAIANEEAALKDDQVKLDSLASYKYCQDIREALLEWGSKRQQKIEKLLGGTLFGPHKNPKKLRRALFKVHEEQLDNLSKIDPILLNGCGEDNARKMSFWLDSYFHARKIAVIKGNAWDYVKDAEREFDNDFNRMKSQ